MVKKKILLVDDEEDIIKMNKLRLSELGFDVISASNGEEAIEKAGSESPDLILLDIMMPGIDGLQTLVRLKNNPETSSVPVVMLSGSGEKITQNKAMLAGAVDYIMKPFNVEMLLEAIKKHLDVRSRKT
ncbi:MAG: response regulator [Candidatus Omnitrophica bacterium]|nr:response regulator [Candidatus Omnitrophota bacterium]